MAVRKNLLVLLLVVAVVLGAAQIAAASLFPLEGGELSRAPRELRDRFRTGLASPPGEQLASPSSIAGLLRHFNATLDYNVETVRGGVVAIRGRLMYLDTANGLVGIYMPGEWLREDVVIGIQDILLEGLLAKGDEVRVEALKISVSKPARPPLSLYIALSLENTDKGVLLKALVPFNVESEGASP
jgi:hypothetical protein